jgi:hypothetical protein
MMLRVTYREEIAGFRQTLAERDAEITRLKASVERHKLGEASAIQAMNLNDVEYRGQLASKDARIKLALEDLWFWLNLVETVDAVLRGKDGEQ